MRLIVSLLVFAVSSPVFGQDELMSELQKLQREQEQQRIEYDTNAPESVLTLPDGLKITYYWKHGDQTFDVDTRDSDSRYMLIASHENWAVLRGVSVVVTEGHCSIGIEVGDFVRRSGAGVQITGRYMVGLPAGRMTLAFLVPSVQLMAARRTITHIYRADNSNSHCKFRVFLRYGTFAGTYLKEGARTLVMQAIMDGIAGKVKDPNAPQNPSVISAGTFMGVVTDILQDGYSGNLGWYKPASGFAVNGLADVVLYAVEKQTGYVDDDVRFTATFMANFIRSLDAKWFDDARNLAYG